MRSCSPNFPGLHQWDDRGQFAGACVISQGCCASGWALAKRSNGSVSGECSLAAILKAARWSRRHIRRLKALTLHAATT